MNELETQKFNMKKLLSKGELGNYVFLLSDESVEKYIDDFRERLIKRKGKENKNDKAKNSNRS